MPTVATFLWGVVDCVRLPFSLTGDTLALRVPIGGYITPSLSYVHKIYTAFHRSHHAPKNKTALKIKRRKRKESKIRLRLSCFAYNLHVTQRPQYNGAFTQCPIDTKAELYNAVLMLKNH